MHRIIRRASAALGMVWGMFTAALSAQAGQGHAHAAPHGGDVVESAKHHVEFKAEPSGAISVWLLDANQKTVAPPRGGRVTLMPEGGEQVTVPLELDSASQQLTATFDARRLKSFQAVVGLPIEGKRHNFRFRYPHAAERP